jgi:hypothetical protein
LSDTGDKARPQKCRAADGNKQGKKPNSPQHEAGDPVGVAGKYLRHPLADLNEQASGSAPNGADAAKVP